MITSFVLSPWKALLLISILSAPHQQQHQQQEKHRNGNGKYASLPSVQVATGLMMSAVGATEEDAIDISIHRPGPALKEWRLNTNFDNVANWQGLAGHENCTKNIYEFPMLTDEVVVTLPSKFIGQQIILPLNGYFIFREGSLTFSSPTLETQQEDTCRGREVKFERTRPADWYDPDNWRHRGKLKTTSDGNSLLMDNPTDSPSTFEAIPHLERVPCQFDSVRFPMNGSSTFNLKISSNVTIAKFFFGTEIMSYVEVATLMSLSPSNLQFKKEPQTVFSVTSPVSKKSNNESSGAGSSSSDECAGNNEEISDSDRCICTHYTDARMGEKICRLADCVLDKIEDDCPYALWPHGFCCGFCGFHLDIRHSGNLRLVPLHSKLKGEITRANLQGRIRIHLSRYKKRSAHIVIRAASRIAPNSEHNETSLLVQMGKLVVRIQSILNKEESEVIGVTLKNSWGKLLPSGESTGIGGSSDRLQGSGLGGGLITLIVFFLLLAILAGVLLFIFIWNNKHGYPPLTLSSVTSALPRIPSWPSMRIPIVSGGGGGGGMGGSSRRRSSTLSNSLHSFGFARFTNERASTVTIGRVDPESSQTSEAGGSSSGEGEKSSVGKSKSSSIRRTEQVDDEALPSSLSGGIKEEKVSDANSGAFGFSDVSYDLVAGVGTTAGSGDEEKVVTKMTKVLPTPLLTIPEVTVVDMDDGESGGGSTSGDLTTTSLSASDPINIPSTNSGNKEEGSKTGKFVKPSFIANRMASTYKKLAPEMEEEQVDQQGGESSSKSESKKGKKQGKGGSSSPGNASPTNKRTKETDNTFPATALVETTDIDQQSGQAERDENQEIFQEFLSVAESTVASAATATSQQGHVEEAKIIDFE